MGPPKRTGEDNKRAPQRNGALAVVHQSYGFDSKSVRTVGRLTPTDVRLANDELRALLHGEVRAGEPRHCDVAAARGIAPTLAE